MDNVLVVAIIAGILFCMGFDNCSYNIMKRIDPLYKKGYKWILGYNTFRLWKSYGKANDNGSS
jgi:hypothetical protein